MRKRRLIKLHILAENEIFEGIKSIDLRNKMPFSVSNIIYYGICFMKTFSIVKSLKDEIELRRQTLR